MRCACKCQSVSCCTKSELATESERVGKTISGEREECFLNNSSFAYYFPLNWLRNELNVSADLDAFALCMCKCWQVHKSVVVVCRHRGRRCCCRRRHRRYTLINLLLIFLFFFSIFRHPSICRHVRVCVCIFSCRWD